MSSTRSERPGVTTPAAIRRSSDRCRLELPAHTMSFMAPTDDQQTFQPLPGRAFDRSAYHALLRDLLDIVGAEPPAAEERGWHHRGRRAVGDAVTRRVNSAGSNGVPDEWFKPLLRAAVFEPDPSFSSQLVRPAVAAFGRRRVQLALIAYLETGTSVEAAGAARAMYWTAVGVRYVPGSKNPTPESAAELEAVRDLYERYRHSALRRFLADDDLDLRRCILPGLTLDPAMYPTEMHDQVAKAVQVARTSGDAYLRHRVEVQIAPRG